MNTKLNKCPVHGGTFKSCNPTCAPKNRPAPLRLAKAIADKELKVTTHTPTPVRIEAEKNRFRLRNESGYTVAVANDKENAVFIVRAVNTHDELVSMIKALLRSDKSESSILRDEALKLVAKAEGK